DRPTVLHASGRFLVVRVASGSGSWRRGGGIEHVHRRLPGQCQPATSVFSAPRCRGGPVVIERIESALAVLRAAADLPPATFSTSFGAEDMVVLDLIRRHALPISIFTLDTGRLPQETYELMQKVEERYGHCVATYFPDAQAVQRLVAENGINGFYASVENRKAC